MACSIRASTSWFLMGYLLIAAMDFSMGWKVGSKKLRNAVVAQFAFATRVHGMTFAPCRRQG